MKRKFRIYGSRASGRKTSVALGLLLLVCVLVCVMVASLFVLRAYPVIVTLNTGAKIVYTPFQVIRLDDTVTARDVRQNWDYIRKYYRSGPLSVAEFIGMRQSLERAAAAVRRSQLANKYATQASPYRETDQPKPAKSNFALQEKTVFWLILLSVFSVGVALITTIALATRLLNDRANARPK